MNAYPIGTSAIGSGQRALDLIGQNISNAATPGYHRQRVDLVSQTYDGVNGVGVDVATITRYAAAPIRTAILRGNSEESSLTARFDARRQIETTLASGPGAMDGRLEDLFNQIERLSTRPEEVALRRPLLAAAADLARQFNSASSDLDRLRADLSTQVTQTVAEVNDFAKRIAGLNSRIAEIEVQGKQANDLRDQRDTLVNELSKRIDIRTVDQPNGVVNVIASGAAVVVADRPTLFEVAGDAAGNLIVTESGQTQPLRFDSGKLSGLLREHNQELPATRGRLETLAREIMRQIDQVQATGLAATGPLTAAKGVRGVANPATPLAAQNLAMAPQAGNLVISVTDTTAGTWTNFTIPIDPAADSLQSVASSITTATGGQVQATVNATTNTLEFQAQAGFAFDFAGRVPATSPQTYVASDTANLLSSLGVNSVFTGDSATSMSVRPELLADPSLLSVSRSGQPGDAGNLERFAALRDQQLLGGGTRTFSMELADINAAVGSDVKALGDQQTAQSGLLQSMNAQEQSVTGVDVNEEVVKLLDFQRMIEAASRYLAVVNTAMDSVLEMIN